MTDDMKVINAPDRIYLQIGDDVDPGEVDFSALQEVTWRADNIHGTDIAYVRADALEAANAHIAELEQELRNIANADTVAWDDPTEFEPWAKNRARHTLAALAKQKEPK
jgi:hypothetical protein